MAEVEEQADTHRHEERSRLWCEYLHGRDIQTLAPV